MFFHSFVLVKILERFIFVSTLVLEIFLFEAFLLKFKIQFLSKWLVSAGDIPKTTANIAIMFTGIHIYIKTITFKKFNC